MNLLHVFNHTQIQIMNKTVNMKIKINTPFYNMEIQSHS